MVAELCRPIRACLVALACISMGEAAVPTESVSGLTMVDLDLDGLDLGGTAQWTEPADTSTVTNYLAGFATDGSGSNFAQFATVPVGGTTAGIVVDTTLGSFTHIVVFTSNADGPQTNPSSQTLVDSDVRVSGVQFADEDLDETDLGGRVSWVEPADTSLVVHYVAYLATLSTGGGRFQIGADVAVGTNLVDLGADTAIGLYSNVIVYTKSALAEQSVPSYVAVADTAAPISTLLLVDQDLDAEQLGGDVTWTEPADLTQVQSYEIYWAEDDGGIVRSPIGSVPQGTNSIAVGAETPITSQTHVVAYTASALAEQTTPVAHFVLDGVSTVTSLAFFDVDLDLGEIGGDITWTAPLDFSQVTYYSTYFALSESGASRFQVGSDIPVATNLPNVPLDVSRGSYTYIVTYTKSALVEQTTPAALLIADAYGGVSDVTFVDKDLDTAQIGGDITWVEPVDTARLVHYTVYFAEDATGTARVQHGSAVLLFTNQISVLPDSDPGSFTHALVYSSSVQAEQNIPSAGTLVDVHASADSIEFIDFDLDAGQLGGQITWNAPGDLSQVLSYNIVFAVDADGTDRSQLGSTLLGTNEITLSSDTDVDVFTHVVVYTQSSLAEQTTPSAAVLADSDSSAANAAFIDYDSDEFEMGGTAEWEAPADTTLVTYYLVYFSTSSGGLGRSQLGSSVPEGTTQVSIDPDTALGSFTHLVVYTRSVLVEQTTPTAMTLADASVTGLTITFTDIDLDVGDIGGTLAWSVPTNTATLTHYAVYLAETMSAGAARSQFGVDLAIGTNELTVYADTALAVFSYFVVHTRTSLVEQTSPAGFLAVADTDGTVVELHFGDRDYDVGEVGGSVSWQEPSAVALVITYDVYRAEDAVGANRVQIGSTFPVGTTEAVLAVSTELGSHTHVVVFAASTLAVQTTPAAVAIADSPAIGTQTRWTIANALSTAPLGNGRPSTPEGAEWTVHEVQFFSDVACEVPVIAISEISSGHAGQYHSPSAALDDDSDTAWRAQCAPCGAFDAHVGVLATDVVRCVRWLQPRVQSGTGARSVALLIEGRELARASNLQGGRWEGLRYGASGGGWQLIF